MSVELVHEHIDSLRSEYMEIWKTLVRQPSISAENEGVRDCALLLRGMMEEAGIEARLIETDGQPVVYGELAADDPEAATILFYGHYDVQPPEPLEAWESPPFEPTVRDGRMYGRGVADNKGQLLAHVLATRSYLETVGSVPINLKFVFEGEEESGSPNLAAFAEEHREMLQADLAYTADGPLYESGAPMVKLGVRGMLQVQLELETARHDNHSGNKGGVIPNAAWGLVDLLGTMRDDDGRIAIEGFYDDVPEPDPVILDIIDRIPYDPERLAHMFGVEEINLSRREFYRGLALQPTLTINGFLSGYTGEGTKTIIPGKAMVKMDMRLVGNQDPMDILEKLKAHVRRHDPRVKVLHRGHMFPSQTRPDLPVVQRVIEGVRKGAGQEPVVAPAMGGSRPDYVWTRVIGIPSVGVPCANADLANHAPNENMEIDLFYRTIHISVQVMHELGQEEKPCD